MIVLFTSAKMQLNLTLRFFFIQLALLMNYRNAPIKICFIIITVIIIGESKYLNKRNPKKQKSLVAVHRGGKKTCARCHDKKTDGLNLLT